MLKKTRAIDTHGSTRIAAVQHHTRARKPRTPYAGLVIIIWNLNFPFYFPTQRTKIPRFKASVRIFNYLFLAKMQEWEILTDRFQSSYTSNNMDKWTYPWNSDRFQAKKEFPSNSYFNQ
ncbi:hypothetical protein DAI22_06g113701 [Oryza sativa Japonica Group]|nr:hypothetical protein DAI22_06g113701 [Oryza sativa Japonica Group]